MGAGEIKKEVHVAGAELAKVRVEVGEAGEVIVRHIRKVIAGHKKRLDYFRVRWECLRQRRDVI